jgi:cob(I)alamin adenosyltransferase
MTGLMYQRRVPKSHPRVEACGAVDELNAALGLARATTEDNEPRGQLLAIQKELISVMGELATLPEDYPRYVKDGYSVVTPAMTAHLEALIRGIEAEKVETRGWATPGSNLAAAALDMARTVCRRAERRVCALQESGQLQNREIVVYLNRLSDLLWLLARRGERPNHPAK